MGVVSKMLKAAVQRSRISKSRDRTYFPARRGLLNIRFYGFQPGNEYQ
jgi:hypothetical protein